VITRRLLTLAMTCAVLAAAVGGSSVQSSVLQHERLRIRNTFKTPEEVVSYYCARDASGFVWSGLLDAERTAFTSWEDAPQVDSFYIAKTYEVHPSEKVGHDVNHAAVQVRYELNGIGDAHGTRSPPPQPDYSVTFDLQKINGAWKIVKPDYAQISPVVVEAKFPYASPSQ
jgi:hypothetical protein